MNEKSLRPAAARVQQLLSGMGLATDVIEFAETTKTSADAAQQIGCSVAQIAKSLIFRARQSNRPVLVIASGVNRVDEKALETLLGEKIGKADAEFVRDKTGYAIGGVAPVGHASPPVTYQAPQVYAQQAYPPSAALDPNNCGTPDEPRPCSRR